MVATGDRKGIESMDIAAVLTKVVQEQERMLKELQEKVVSLVNSLQLKKDKISTWRKRTTTSSLRIYN